MYLSCITLIQDEYRIIDLEHQIVCLKSYNSVRWRVKRKPMNNDFYTKQPLYYQVADQLQKVIESGAHRSGNKLPSEKELGELCNVSRVTIRKALCLLTSRGYIYTEKGKGSFVKPFRLKHDFLSMSGLSQEAADSGLTTRNQIIAFEVQRASEDVIEKLGIQPLELVNYVARLRIINDKVVSYEEFYIPHSLLPNLRAEDLEGSKFAYLKKSQLEMIKTHQKIIPALPEPRIQALLNTQENEPILINRSQNFCSDTQIYEYSIVYYKSSVYDFEINAQR